MNSKRENSWIKKSRIFFEKYLKKKNVWGKITSGTFSLFSQENLSPSEFSFELNKILKVKK